MLKLIESTIQPGHAALDKLRVRGQAITARETGHIVVLVVSVFTLLYTAMLIAQLVVAATWIGKVYRYQGKEVTCFGEACWTYSDHGATHVRTFLSLWEPMANAFWVTLIMVGIMALAMICDVSCKRWSHLIPR